MNRLREHSLEEGNAPTARTIAVALLEYVHEYAAVRTYVAAWVWLVALVLLRPPLAPPARVLVNPAEYASLYGAMPSAPVALETDVDGVVRDMRRSMVQFNLTLCFAAIHMAVPLRVGIVGPAAGDDEDVVLVNPALVVESGLDKMSTARERSPFWPDHRGTKVRRAFPVTVRDRRGYHLFTDRAQAHCVHHLLDAFEGRHRRGGE